MTKLIKCDKCGKIQNTTDEKYYSLELKDADKIIKTWDICATCTSDEVHRFEG